MSRNRLTLRINRRAIGAVVLADESLKLADGRHLTSQGDKTVAAATRFVDYVLDLSRPTLLVVDAPPHGADSATTRIVSAVREQAASRGIEILEVGKAEVLSAYGIKGVRTRGEVRDLVRDYFPELSAVRGRVHSFVTDAAAAALYAECRIHLERASA